MDAIAGDGCWYFIFKKGLRDYSTFLIPFFGTSALQLTLPRLGGTDALLVFSSYLSARRRRVLSKIETQEEHVMEMYRHCRQPADGQQKQSCCVVQYFRLDTNRITIASTTWQGRS